MCTEKNAADRILYGICMNFVIVGLWRIDSRTFYLKFAWVLYSIGLHINQLNAYNIQMGPHKMHKFNDIFQKMAELINWGETNSIE